MRWPLSSTRTARTFWKPEAWRSKAPRPKSSRTRESKKLISANKPIFFRTPSDLRKWFEKNHATAKELLVGFYKKSSGKPSVTWPESVDEALCVGWIDGIRRSLDAERYTIRFTPRRPRSIWSNVNIRRAQELIRSRRMRSAGKKAFEKRVENRSGIYSYEQRRDRLEEPFGKVLRENKAASQFFDAQPPSYRKAIGWWVVCARKDETRWKRLRILIEHSERGERIPPFTPRKRDSRGV